MSRRLLPIAFACAYLSASLTALPAQSHPNVLFILCDDLGYGEVGAFFQNQRAAQKDSHIPFFTTPNIDTLARDGVKLNQHYCGAPVCAPSRASLLAGLTQGHANVRDNQFDKALADSLTMGSVLQKAGYATAAIGKWGLQGQHTENTPEAKKNEPITGNPSVWPAYPTKRGFDYYFGGVRHSDGHYHYPKEDKRQVWDNDREISSGLDLCYTTDLYTARAKKWIVDQKQAHPQQPFFVYLAYDTPHAALVNPPCPYPAGGGLHGGVQWLGTSGHMINTATGTRDGWMHPDYANATWTRKKGEQPQPWPEVQKRYANDVRRIDDCVGDLLQLLKDMNLQEDTLVVFTSDNGPSAESYLPKQPYAPNFFHGFGPFDGIKRDTWEGGMREPTLARWPGAIPAGRVCNEPSGQWDWMTTLAEIAGLPAPAASDGVSLLPCLTGQGTRNPGILYIEYFHNQRTPNYPEFAPAHRNRERKQMQVVFMKGFKGIRYNIQSPEDDFEIYNVSKDKKEEHNLAQAPEMAALQTAMKARALQVRKPDPSAPRPYDQALVPPLDQEPAGDPGLNWALFKGQWPWMPDFRTLTPVTNGKCSGIDLTMAGKSGACGVGFTGYFHAAEDGEYTFHLQGDSGAMLFLHEIRLIDESLRNPGAMATGMVRLKAGWHPIRVYYRHTKGTANLKISCELAGGKSIKLDESCFRQGPEK